MTKRKIHDSELHGKRHHNLNICPECNTVKRNENKHANIKFKMAQNSQKPGVYRVIIAIDTCASGSIGQYRKKNTILSN